MATKYSTDISARAGINVRYNTHTGTDVCNVLGARVRVRVGSK